jgi:hypothetical protein
MYMYIGKENKSTSFYITTFTLSCHVYISPDCSFMIAPFAFSNVYWYLLQMFATIGPVHLSTRYANTDQYTIVRYQSILVGHGMNNLETQATLGTAKGTIMNEQSGDTTNTGHKTQDDVTCYLFCISLLLSFYYRQDFYRTLRYEQDGGCPIRYRYCLLFTSTFFHPSLFWWDLLLILLVFCLVCFV